MASNFLKNKAEEQAERIEKEFGPEAYGSTTYIENEVKKAKEEKQSDPAAVQRLREKVAKEQEKKIETLTTKDARYQYRTDKVITKGEQISTNLQIIVIAIIIILLLTKLFNRLRNNHEQ